MHPFMKRVLVPGLLTLICSVLSVGACTALCSSSTLDEGIHAADIIFAGTVRRCESFRDGGTIRTRYYFGSVRYVKGARPDSTLTLTQDGGSLGSMVIEVEEEVHFVVGMRYVVLSREWEGRLSAMSCVPWNPLVIWADSGSSDPIVHAGSLSVVYFQGNHLVFLNSRPWQPSPGITRYNIQGEVIPQSPPERLPLADEVRQAEDQLPPSDQRWIPGIGWSRNLVRGSVLWPHQDPGTRVSEDEFLERLAEIVASQARLGAEPPDTTTNFEPR